MWWDTTNSWWVFPQRKGGVAIEDHSWRSLDEQWQQVPKNLRRNCDDAAWSEQRPKHVCITKRVGDCQLRQHAGREAQIDADREHMPTPDTATGSDDELVARERVSNRA